MRCDCISIQVLSTVVTVFFIVLTVAVSVAITTHYSTRAATTLSIAQARVVSDTLANDMKNFLCLNVGHARGIQMSASSELIPKLRGVGTAEERMQIASNWINLLMSVLLSSNFSYAYISVGVSDDTYLNCYTVSDTEYSCGFMDGLNKSAVGDPYAVFENRYRSNSTLIFQQQLTSTYRVTNRSWYLEGPTTPNVVRWGTFRLSWLPMPTPIINVAGSLQNNGSFVGVVSLSRKLQDVSDYLYSSSKGTGADVFLLENRDDILAHNMFHADLVQTYTSPADVSLHQDTPSCVSQTSVDGNVSIACRKSIDQFGFAPLIELKQSSHFDDQNSLVTLQLNGEKYFVSFASLQDNTESWRMVSFLSYNSTVGKLPDRLRWAIIIAAILGVVASLVGMVILAVLLRPLRQLSECIKNTATLSEDGLRGMSSTRILDVERIRIALNFLCCELAKTKSFLPEAVVAPAGSQDWDEGSLSDYSGSAATDSKSTVAVPELQPSPNLHSRGTMLLGLNTSLRVQHRRTSVLCVNVRGFHQMSKLWSLDEFSRKYGEVVSAILKISRQRKGVLDLFHGDRFFITYNAFASAANHALAAALTAVSFLVEMPGIQLTCGVAAGIALVGTMGSAATKRTGVVGEVFSASVLLERLCKYYPHANPILTCGSAAVDSSIQTETVHLDIIRVPGATNPRILTSIRNERTAAVAEWMYELEDVIAESRYSKLNNAFVAFHEGGYAKAIEQLDVCDATGSDVEAPKLLLRSLIAAGVDGTQYFNPLTNYYASCVCSSGTPFELPQQCEDSELSPS